MMRTHTCGELRKEHDGETVTLCGWADTVRTMGKVGFIDVRDRYGITQVFLNKDLKEEFGNIRNESVIKITGLVKVRPKANEKLETGEVEVSAENIEVLNASEPLPLDMSGEIESTEETRLKYRYLELRKPKLSQNIITRHKIAKAIRDSFYEQNFIEIETPMLAKSTPEGARDYLVPSRVNKGKFYALPQSPQIFKQILMISGFDRYFQIVRCFRDEDLRSDRQPEFTQLDMEMSFVEPEDIFASMEKMMVNVWKAVFNEELKTPFPRMTHAEAMEKYKSDKPDIRKDGEKFAFLWVTDFPLFEKDKDSGKWTSVHHPFTSPNKEDIDLIESNPGKARSLAYDLVLNGWELGSGSIRIHNREVQKRIFKSLGISNDESEEKFGFLMNAFRYGAPPHGGFALGLDRTAALLTGNTSIREVIAFPKNKDAEGLMMGTPSKISEEQLKELGLK